MLSPVLRGFSWRNHRSTWRPDPTYTCQIGAPFLCARHILSRGNSWRLHPRQSPTIKNRIRTFYTRYHWPVSVRQGQREPPGCNLRLDLPWCLLAGARIEPSTYFAVKFRSWVPVRLPIDGARVLSRRSWLWRSAMNSAPDLPKVERADKHSLGFFSSESVLNILKLILAGSELSEVLAIIAGLVESQGNGNVMHHLASRCGRNTSLLRVAVLGLPGFAATVGRNLATRPQGASCGTAVYRREPVYVADILREPIWDDYRDLAIRSLWHSCRLVATPVHA